MSQQIPRNKNMQRLEQQFDSALTASASSMSVAEAEPEMDMDAMVMAAHTAMASRAAPAPMMMRSKRAMPLSLHAAPMSMSIDAEDLELRDELKQRKLYTPPSDTKVLGETGYYDVKPGTSVSDLIPPLAFWADCASQAGDGLKPVLPASWLECCSSSVNAALLLLALLDLPFEVDTTASADGDYLVVEVTAPCTVFVKQIEYEQ